MASSCLLFCFIARIFFQHLYVPCLFTVFSIIFSLLFTAFNTIYVCIQLSGLCRYFVYRLSSTVCFVLCALLCFFLPLFSDFMFMMSVTWLSAVHTTVMDSFFFLFVCLFCRSLTSNLPNVNLPNVNLQIPKVPNLPVPVAGLSVNLPQMPSFSTPSWMAAIYDSECVFT